METFLPAIRSRPHIFREPDLWTLEPAHLVRTSPDGTRLELPLSSLNRIHIWRSSPVEEDLIHLDAYVLALVRFDARWYKLYGSYPDGLEGIKNQSGAVSAMIYALITAQQHDPALVIRIGSRAEGVSAKIITGVLVLLPAGCLLVFPILAYREPSLSFPGVLIASLLACLACWVIAWWKLGAKITRLREAGRLSFMTPAQYLDEPPF